jgi:carbamoyl-phosphate synthase large subunit
MTNVLLTSVGRRSYLVDYFRHALGADGRVIVANSNPEAAAVYQADTAYHVPASWHPEYLESILDICRSDRVSLLCSLHDVDTYFLAQHSQAFREIGVTPVLPSADWARICLDKLECSRHLHAHGFAVPWCSVSLQEARIAIQQGETTFPLLAKARFGFGSLGLMRCHNLEELAWAFHKLQQTLSKSGEHMGLAGPAQEIILIQAYIPGQEYCVDIIHDLDGKYAAHFIGQVHAMRSGESDSLTTVEPGLFGNLPQRLSSLTRHLGIWGADLLLHDGCPYVIDINPRFTGDYPFHHLAGADIPAALVAWVEKRTPAPEWLKPAVGFRGYKDLVPKSAPRALPQPAPHRAGRSPSQR